MLPVKIPTRDLNRSPILQLINRGSAKPTVFFPNYGEFGSTIHRFIKVVYFFSCPEKIVCCKKGEEAYFPNADGFFYDWDDFVDEKYKWGFFSKRKITGLGKNVRYSEYKRMLVNDTNHIKAEFGEEYNYVLLWNYKNVPIFDKYHHHLVFEMMPTRENGISADVIISPRNRSSRHENNFYEWDKIIRALNQEGYTVGSVGSKNQSFSIKGSSVNSWDYDDNASAVIELLSKCRLYLGLDTGVSHLAAFMSTPMIVFSHSGQSHYLTSYMAEINKNYFLDLGKNVKDISIIIENILKFLERQENNE